VLYTTRNQFCLLRHYTLWFLVMRPIITWTDPQRIWSSSEFCLLRVSKDMELFTFSYLSVADCWLYQRNISFGVEVQGVCMETLSSGLDLFKVLSKYLTGVAEERHDCSYQYQICSFVMYSLSRQVHRLFQSAVSKECELMLPLSNSSNRSFI